MKVYYVVKKERANDESHEHELDEIFRSESLVEAENHLVWKENLYGRIEEVHSNYTPPPRGKKWKEERFGWSDEFVRVIKEN